MSRRGNKRVSHNSNYTGPKANGKYYLPELCQDYNVNYNLNALVAMNRDIGSRRPETGGFLFGFIDHAARLIKVEHFKFDSGASVTSASYVPSAQRDYIINTEQQETGLHFLGVVHSHPDGLEQPSGPDEEAMEEIMRVNPTITLVVAPIINQVVRYVDFEPEHQLYLNDYETHKIGTFIKVKGHPYCRVHAVIGENRPVIRQSLPLPELSPEVLNRVEGVLRDLFNASPRILESDIGGEKVTMCLVDAENNLRVCLVMYKDLDVAPPLLFVKYKGNDIDFSRFLRQWDATEQDVFERLSKALKTLFSMHTYSSYSSDFYVAYGSSPDNLITEDPEIAGEIGLLAFIIRGKPILPQPRYSYYNKSVTIVGCNGVGCQLASTLQTRVEVGGITLVDESTVGIEDIVGSTLFTRDHQGMSKAEALKRSLLEFSPSLKVKTIKMTDLETEDLGNVLVGCFDDWESQKNVAEIGHKKEILTVIPHTYTAPNANKKTAIVMCHKRGPTFETICRTLGSRPPPTKKLQDQNQGKSRGKGKGKGRGKGNRSTQNQNKNPDQETSQSQGKDQSLLLSGIEVRNCVNLATDIVLELLPSARSKKYVCAMVPDFSTNLFGVSNSGADSTRDSGPKTIKYNDISWISEQDVIPLTPEKMDVVSEEEDSSDEESEYDGSSSDAGDEAQDSKKTSVTNRQTRSQTNAEMERKNKNGRSGGEEIESKKTNAKNTQHSKDFEFTDPVKAESSSGHRIHPSEYIPEPSPDPKVARRTNSDPETHYTEKTELQDSRSLRRLDAVHKHVTPQPPPPPTTTSHTGTRNSGTSTSSSGTRNSGTSTSSTTGSKNYSTSSISSTGSKNYVASTSYAGSKNYSTSTSSYAGSNHSTSTSSYTGSKNYGSYNTSSRDVSRNHGNSGNEGSGSRLKLRPSTIGPSDRPSTWNGSQHSAPFYSRTFKH